MNLVFLEEAVHGLRDVSGVNGVVVRVATVVALLHQTCKRKMGQMNERV